MFSPTIALCPCGSPMVNLCVFAACTSPAVHQKCSGASWHNSVSANSRLAGVLMDLLEPKHNDRDTLAVRDLDRDTVEHGRVWVVWVREADTAEGDTVPMCVRRLGTPRCW